MSLPPSLSALHEVDSTWAPQHNPNQLFSTGVPRSYTIFTDGSTPRDGNGVSGYSAIIYDSTNLKADPITLGLSWLKCSGNNYLAEVAAVKAVPS